MIRDADTLEFARDGARRTRGAIGIAALHAFEDALVGLPHGRAGVRLRGPALLRALVAADGPVGAIAASTLCGDCRAVRAILFDKTPATNWSLAWHQDRTIAVAKRIDVEGFGPWTVKSGLLHVAPPYGILSRMVTLRIHLDAVPATNAPLLIAPGSHRLGEVPTPAIAEAVRRCGTATCFAEPGDIWVYATPILHASEAATHPTRRRVVQVDYSADELPGGLEWLGL